MGGDAIYEVSYEKNGRRERKTYKHHQQGKKTYIQEYGGAMMKSVVTDVKLKNDEDESEKVREIFKQDGCTNVTCRRLK